MHSSELNLILQASVSPVILISGVGLLLLSMTNRLGRLIDRARVLSAEAKKAGSGSPLREMLRHELNIIYNRTKDIRLAVILAVVSIFCVALLIISLFCLNTTEMKLEWLAVIFFLGSLSSLILSLCFFLKEIFLSLDAVKLEITAPEEEPNK